MKDDIRLGIIGVGAMGNSHARSILAGKVEHCRLTALGDIRPQALESITDPTPARFNRGEDLIDSGMVDAVIIATPHFSHTALGIYALKKGLHVLVEKPISVHKADAERLIAAHTNKRQIFSTMFDVRTDPRYQKLRQMVRGGELGEIRRINWVVTDWFRSEAYYRSGTWRATWAGEGGGILVNQLPHDLDLFQWIFGMPKTVRGFCKIGKHHDIEVEDEISAFFEFENGASAILVASTGEAPGTDRREIVGERGRILVHPDHLAFTRNEIPTTEFSRTTKAGFAKPDVWEVRIPIPGTATRHVGILNNFIAAIRTGADLIAPAADGIHSAEIANAILYSSFLEKTIEFPLDGVAYEKFLKEKMAGSIYPKKQAAQSLNDGIASSFKA